MIGLPVNVEELNAPSAASSITIVPEALFSPPVDNPNRLKRKSPPNVSPYPISCLKCNESSEVSVKADYDSKTVKCAKCKHIATAEDYDQSDFLKACFYDSKPSATSGFKKHQETAYISMLADLERAKNESKHLELKREELIMREKELERNEIEHSKRLQHEITLEETRQSTQAQLFKMQSESTAAMQQLISSIIPKKTALEKYKESKAAITAMLVAGDISAEVGSQLIRKLDEDLLNATII